MNKIEFALSTPNVDLQYHVTHALSLGLPEADFNQKRLHLIANGPSAINCPDWNCPIETMAVNGALKLFTDRGQWPSYWIACDPQEHVIDFLDVLPESTTYLVASKCHPKVFERLKDRNVRLWHVNDVPMPSARQVPCAVSVTICALLLAQRLGFREIDVWGWDLCFDGEQHHAGIGELSTTPDRINIEVGDNESHWVSNPTWACEVKDASGVLPVLKWTGVDVRIHGKSMLAAILPQFAA